MDIESLLEQIDIPTWEYERVHLGEISLDRLNTLGKEGWEAIACTGSYMYLKRMIGVLSLGGGD